jgi:putative DNA methylase
VPLGKKGFRCLLTESPIGFDYVREESRQGRVSTQLIAIVAEVPRGRIYLSTSDQQVAAANSPVPVGYPDSDLPGEALGFRVQNYGFKKHWQMFTRRQLMAIVTLSDLIRETRAEIEADAARAGFSVAKSSTYAKAITTFLALSLDRCADFNNSFCRWKPSGQQSIQLFARQAVPMVWDFVEPNIMGKKAVCWHTAVNICAAAIETIAPDPKPQADARQIDAASNWDGICNLLISTDPPYYDNIGYAALSDFFYIWLRRTIGDIYPELFATMLAPKIQELTASPELFDGNKHQARDHFESGFRKAFSVLRDKMDTRFPLTVYYAFKQSDEEDGVDADDLEAEEVRPIDLSTGWETLLEALISTGFQITATWPVRASQAWRMRAMGSNALASYIVLTCRSRPSTATQTDRRSFVAELKDELPTALRHLQQGNIAPVDFAQASIGPGMAIYSKYSRILESNGQAMSVRTALSLINQTLTEVLTEREEVFDSDTRWALAWFEQHAFGESDFGDAELLSKAKVTSVEGLREAGILASKRGKVRLLRREELSAIWDPASDKRLTVWGTCEHLIQGLQTGGETGAAALMSMVPSSTTDAARDLAYRLFNICERKGWAQEALAYNSLIISWPEVARLAQNTGGRVQQGNLL